MTKTPKRCSSNVTILVWFLLICLFVPWLVTQTMNIYKHLLLGAQEDEVSRAFQQVAQADLVLQCNGSRIVGVKQFRRKYGKVCIFSKQHVVGDGNSLALFIHENNIKPDLVVIIMEKGTQMWDLAKFKKTVVELHQELRSVKFQSIIFQIATGNGRTIYKEFGKKI